MDGSFLLLVILLQLQCCDSSNYAKYYFLIVGILEAVLYQ
jgi:hypothetical protein